MKLQGRVVDVVDLLLLWNTDVAFGVFTLQWCSVVPFDVLTWNYSMTSHLALWRYKDALALYLARWCYNHLLSSYLDCWHYNDALSVDTNWHRCCSETKESSSEINIYFSIIDFVFLLFHYITVGSIGSYLREDAYSFDWHWLFNC